MVPAQPCKRCGLLKCPLRTCPSCKARPSAAQVREANELLERAYQAQEANR